MDGGPITDRQHTQERLLVYDWHRQRTAEPVRPPPVGAGNAPIGEDVGDVECLEARGMGGKRLVEARILHGDSYLMCDGHEERPLLEPEASRFPAGQAD